MTKPLVGEVVEAGFAYDLLEPKTAREVRSTTGRIRGRVKRTVEDLIAVGHDLGQVKEALPHGQFGKWLKAEFGWGERTAQNFMSVAGQFGPKRELIADLRIAPTAAYLLAAPSASDEARERAIARAESGETITAKVARDILAQARKKGSTRGKRAKAGVLAPRLLATLERYHRRWSHKELAELARHLRQFADRLDQQEQDRAGKKAHKA